MTEYDNTNRGVIFTPHEEQTLSGQGKIDIEGSESRYIVMFEPVSRDGKKHLVLYERAGVLFPNDKKGNDKAPDFSGPLDRHPDYRIAAWKKEKDGRKYMSLSASRREGQGGGSASSGDGWGDNQTSDPDPRDMDDEIPF